MARRRNRMMRRKGRRIQKRKFKSFAKRVNKAVRYQSEKKQVIFNTGNPGLTVQTGADSIAQLLTGVPTGTETNQRIGNKIRGRYIKIQGFITSNGLPSTAIRMSIVRTRTAGIAIGDFPTNDQWSFFDKEKFEVIYDRRMLLNATDESGNVMRPFKLTVRCFRDMLFDNNTNTSQTTNLYYFFVTSNDALLPSPIIYYSSIFSFTDI